MISNAVAVELLIDKGGFEPRQALGIVEAIEISMTHAQIVTTPILDARFAQLEVKIESVKAELVRWVFVAMLGNAVLSGITAALLNAFQHAR